MRKLIVSMNVSLDGLMAGPEGELDWHFNSWNSEMTDLLCEHLSQADTILLGRNTYTAMANYWPWAGNCLSTPREHLAYAFLMNSYAKVVFSRSLSSPGWCNSSVIRGDLPLQVLKLKKQPGKDIIIYGSGKLVHSLMRTGLIDEYRLWVHPVALGNGRRFFGQLMARPNIRLAKIHHFSSGVILACYDTGTG